MPTDKSLPDDDIIDLTDLVEEGASGAAPTEAASPSDMSFEQELEDLFGDAEPMASKADAAPATGTDDDLIDLEGMDLADAAPGAAKSGQSGGAGDDDLMDLAGLGFDEPETPAAAKPAPPAGKDDDTDLVDLAGLGFDEPETPAAAKPAPPAGKDDDADLMDLAGLGFDEPETPGATTAPAGAAPEPAALDFDLPPPPPPAQTPAAAPDAQPADLEDLGLPAPTPGLADTAAMDALLGDLPEEVQPAPVAAEQEPSFPADLPDLEEPSVPQPVSVPTPAAPIAPVPVTPAAVAVPLPAKATGAAIDLDALDKLITTATSPQPEPETPPADLLAVLADRLDILESALAGLADKLDDRAASADRETLAQTLAERLEATLAARLDGLRLELAPVGAPAVTADDLETLRTELAQATPPLPDPEDLVAQLRQALAPDFDALRQSLPAPDAWVTPKGLAEALTGLRESLSVDLAAVLRTAKQAARDEAAAVGEALSARLDALENDRLDPEELAEKVRQALLPSHAENESALETAKLALAGLAERVATEDFQTALATLKTELGAEIQRAVPQAAAAVIREEIAALAKALEE